MGGRFLARGGAHLAAGNLLWLAFEQIAKVLILQKRLNSMALPEGQPDKRVQDMTDIFALLDSEAKRIRPYHEWPPLLGELTTLYPDLDLSSYERLLAKMQEFFSMRYYREAGHKFSCDEVDLIDSCYFRLRDRVVLDLGMGKIDVLYLLRANGKLDLRSPFEDDLFEKNKALRPRPACASHPKFCMGYAAPGISQTLYFPSR